ncbi:molybdate ABC transporter, periplasmic molybdate-binding protein [Acinetobacter nectaris CIP 110549]|uniref:Molybdate ABC transporter, periplasmic molybdate-binding protein n=1 Tax=Acinetobacter nectaris CIP 110549 TaxID=1392540 RepID=V2TZF3_9GAMM|nr:molybdate ABC transporter substrate-binding protein [Acinetobacter nectaris]ESK41285.1 molybdate ABC transporter, periplasmic molybdate-binding protein [Acinetobacter nectaris CIP 110549]
MKKLILSGITLTMCMAAHADTVRIYAAASLTNAINEISSLYEKKYPDTKIVTSYAASSTLAKQVEVGAPSDIFFSADQDWMDYLVKKQKVSASQVRNLLVNELVVIAPQDSKVIFKAVPQFNFAQSFNGHLCTGQMESVPVGKYAKQSLIKLHWLGTLNNRIVGTDDVRSALAFVERGECDVGIVYKTDAMISRKVKILGTFPENSHGPISYPVAVTKQGESNKDAQKLIQFITKDHQARIIFEKYGFVLN